MGREAAEHINNFGIFFGLGGKLLDGLGVEEHGGELSGSDLKTDFGELRGVVLAKVIGEVVLHHGELELPFLFEAPFLVAAAGAPVGDVALGDDDALLVEGSNDFFLRYIVLEQAADKVAVEFGQAGDFAVACIMAGTIGQEGGRHRQA